MLKLKLTNLLMLAFLTSATLLFSFKDEEAELSTVPYAMGDTVISADALDEQPVALNNVMPKYPEEARKAGLMGTVIVLITIDKKGRVEAADIKQSVPGLDEAALDAARQMLFKPMKHKGQAVRVQLAAPFKFKLDAKGKKEATK